MEAIDEWYKRCWGRKQRWYHLETFGSWSNNLDLSLWAKGILGISLTRKCHKLIGMLNLSISTWMIHCKRAEYLLYFLHLVPLSLKISKGWKMCPYWMGQVAPPKEELFTKKQSDSWWGSREGKRTSSILTLGHNFSCYCFS